MRIGDYEFLEQLGEGGMAVVYRARHLSAGREVALKILRPRSDGSITGRARARDEIRATAQLTHPNIVSLLDVGTVERDLVVEGFDVAAGTDFLVLELMRGGALSSHWLRDWPQVQRLLAHVLAGLAHAHARGVIHRDLKPDNILLDDVLSTSTPKIADFGLAHLDPDTVLQGSGQFSGTPHYMAPEQIRGELRDYGPWTDLYAVGCVAHELVTGRPPYQGSNYLDVLNQHLHADRPSLPRGLPVPPGLEAWLGWLLDKDPRSRCQHAADAAWSLLTLPPVPAPAPLASNATPVASVATTLAAPTIPWLPETLPMVRNSEAFPGVESAPSHRVDEAPLPTKLIPPVPRIWAEELGHHRQVLRHTGVKLHGLRPVPLLRRDEERALLWNALRAVHDAGTPMCILVEGASGTGKSRLLGSFAAAAAECGAARSLWAEHERRDEFHGLGGMVRRHFRIGGLDAASALERIERWLGDLASPEFLRQARLWTPWVGHHASNRDPADVTPTTVGTAHELLGMLTRDRPAVLVVDDAQWGPEALFVLREILRRDELPVLAVLAHDPTAVDAWPGVDGLLRDLAASPQTRRIVLDPVPDKAQHALLTEWYGLEFEAAVGLLAHSRGDLRYLQNLLADAIERGALEASADGWAIGRPEELSLPRDTFQLVRDRLDRFLQDASASGGSVEMALELAATLGSRFEEDVFRRGCAGFAAGADEVLEQAHRAHLLEPTSGGDWRFVDEMIRAVLLRSAAASGRDVEMHERAARALRPVASRGSDHFTRYATHVARSAADLPALGIVIDAARTFLWKDRELVRMIELFREIASALPLEIDSPVVVDAITLYARYQLHPYGEFDAACSLLTESLAAARRIGDERLSSEAAAALAWWEICVAPTSDTAVRLADEALGGLPAIDSPESRARVVGDATLVLGCVGRAAEADRILQDAYDSFASDDEVACRTYVASYGLEVAICGGLLERIPVWMARANDERESASGHDTLVWRHRAQAAEMLDEHDELLRCKAQLEALAPYSNRNPLVLTELLAVLSACRHDPAATSHRQLEWFDHLVSPTLYEYVRLQLAHVLLAVVDGDSARAARHLALAEPGLRTGKVVYGIARDASLAAERARQQGMNEIADALASIAARQWEKLGHPR